MRPLAVFALGWVVLAATPVLALHQESPGALRLTSGVPHQASAGRSWGNFVAFASTEDLAGVGAARVPGPQIFVFNLAYYDCAHGTTFPATPCPPVGTPYLVQATNGPGAPANPSVSQPPSGSTTPFDVWIAFDALGSYLGNAGAPATRRQIFLKNLVTNEVRQVTVAGDGDSVRPSLSSIAGVVAFESTAMLAGFPNLAGVSQVYVHERSTNVTRQLSLTPAPANVVRAQAEHEPHAERGRRRHCVRVDRRSRRERRRHRRHADLLGRLRPPDARRDAAPGDRGNAPSRNPFAGNAPKAVVFESEATDLPGTSGAPGRNVYEAAITDPPTPLSCSSSPRTRSSGIAGARADDSGTRFLFVCTGDPLQNLTVGGRLFVFDSSTTTLYQLTGLGAVSGRPAGNVGQWFATVATSSDLTGAGTCTTQLHVLDYFAGRWDAATQLGQYPEDVTATNACGGNCTTSAECDDANPCNGVETCGPEGFCVRGIPVVCSDGNVCNGVETCNPATGTCVGGAPLVCNDANPCTNDACHPTLGCTATPNALPCDDGDPCTTGDACGNGACKAAPLPCPTCERCDPGTGRAARTGRVAPRGRACGRVCASGRPRSRAGICSRGSGVARRSRRRPSATRRRRTTTPSASSMARTRCSCVRTHRRRAAAAPGRAGRPSRAAASSTAIQRAPRPGSPASC
jgi:hypothetical protein